MGSQFLIIFLKYSLNFSSFKASLLQLTAALKMLRDVNYIIYNVTKLAVL